ncbi:MAG: class I SAM-dependent methyltransferase, partial [Steroidobacteraceae bacterium]
ALARGLTNLEVITCDVNQLQFQPGTLFDRVVSVEMFEHMRNYQTLLANIASWMAPSATLFVHIFTHHRFAYTFEIRDESDWMAKYFFTGGIMPSDDLLHYFQQDLRLMDHWQVDGRHYQLTSEAWLANMDAQREKLWPILTQAYGSDQTTRWWVYWRVFFMSCAVLFGYPEGRELVVSTICSKNLETTLAYHAGKYVADASVMVECRHDSGSLAPVCSGFASARDEPGRDVPIF